VDVDPPLTDGVDRGEDAPVMEADPRLGRRQDDIANPESELLKETVEGNAGGWLACQQVLHAVGSARVGLTSSGESPPALWALPHG
jgi:hypothetical protein